MNLDDEVVTQLSGAPWFAEAGRSTELALGFAVLLVPDANAALASARSEAWADVRTEAQGDLTGYLAKHHYDAYGGHWNRLGQMARSELQEKVMPAVDAALGLWGVRDDLSESVLLDLSRIVLYATYKKRFRRIPDFFGRLLAVYATGHLPCGWDGGLAAWPSGTLMVH